MYIHVDFMWCCGFIQAGLSSGKLCFFFPDLVFGSDTPGKNRQFLFCEETGFGTQHETGSRLKSSGTHYCCTGERVPEKNDESLTGEKAPAYCITCEKMPPRVR